MWQKTEPMPFLKATGIIYSTQMNCGFIREKNKLEERHFYLSIFIIFQFCVCVRVCVCACVHVGICTKSLQSSEDSVRGWRNGSAVKSTDCSSRGPGFNSQHKHVSSQLSENPVTGDLTPSHQWT